MNKISLGILCCLFLLTMLPQTYVLAEQPDLPEAIKQAKKPNDYLEWGFDHRIRYESFPHAISHDREVFGPISEWWRFRTRVYLNLKLSEDTMFKMRIANETRKIVTPDPYVRSYPYDRYDRFDVVNFDNLYFEFKELWGSPLTLRVGRQDMLALPGTSGPMGTGFGSGFMIMDGTSLDGSRDFFFDAIRGTLDLDQWIDKTSLDVIALQTKSDPTDHLPNLFGYDDYKRYESYDSEALILYLKNASWIPKTQTDLYYFYKDSEQAARMPWEQTTPAGVITNTAGFRLSNDCWKGAKLELEGAMQWGSTQGRDIRAFASEESLEQALDLPYKPKLKIFHVLLTGDNPDTTRVESWQQFYGRYPKWGELIGYHMGPETGVYNLINLQILGMQIDTTPCENVTFTGILQAVFADENTYRDRVGFADTGLYRGLNPQVVLTWKPTKYIATHFRYELLFPGDYYADAADDVTYHFARGELEFKF